MKESRFKIANLEIYFPRRHGYIKDENLQYIYGTQLILFSVNINEFYDEINNIIEEIQLSKQIYTEYINNSCSHPFIRNYKNIIEHPKHLELKIIESINIKFGPGEEDYYSTGIDKTFWLRLIQRRWRNIWKKRLQSKMNINNLKYREINGIWPKECHIPFRLGI